MEKNKKSLASFYFDLFSIQEIADSLRLQVVAAVAWLLYLFDLVTYSRSPHQFSNPFKSYNLRCWTYFPQCQKYLRFDAFPFSYSYSLWMAVLLGFLFIALWQGLHKKWGSAHFFFLIAIIWRVLFQFVLVNYHTVNFDIFYIVPSLILLLSKNKIQGLKYTWALCYLFAARVKLDDAWILGTYFTSTTLGLPFVPQVITPLVTNVSIFFEIICAFGLISRSQRGNKLSLFAWTLFHLISVINVGYVFSFRCLSFLWAIFGLPELDKDQHSPLPGRSWATVAVTVILCFMNFIPIIIPGDVNRTFSAIDYGLHMVDANHQCINKLRYFSADNKLLAENTSGQRDPMKRCFPETYLQDLQNGLCRRIRIGERVEWTLWHSKNGGPFYETIHSEDACQLRYQAFAKNSWIKEPQDGAPLRGYPEKNTFYKSGYSGPPPVYQSSQGEPFTYAFLRENFQVIREIYLVIWTLAFVYLLFEILAKNLWSKKEKGRS